MEKHVLAAHSNTSVDGEDFAWLWDVGLEERAHQAALQMALRSRGEMTALDPTPWSLYAGLGTVRRAGGGLLGAPASSRQA
jgi:hypothetical protein